jgi:hypothetical protein
MQKSKLARISALALVLSLFLPALPAFAVPPCGCNYCQRFPQANCSNDGAVITCLEFLAVALCQPVQPATSADAPSSKEAFLAALSGQPTQQPAGGLNLSR